MPVFRWLAVALVPTALASGSVAAQDTLIRRFAVFAAPALDSPEGTPFQFATTYSLDGAGSFGARFDLAGVFRKARPTLVDLCPQPPAPCGPSSSETGLVLYGATANVVYVDRRANQGYWIAGIGLYGVTVSSDGAYLRPGWNLGVGWWLGRATFIEARYHGIVRPAGQRAFLPITFGLRF